tara:strand:+ start:108 stop:1289 length:1182 start_codon:yes stop_codon:yes gene_type:complete
MALNQITEQERKRRLELERLALMNPWGRFKEWGSGILDFEDDFEEGKYPAGIPDYLTPGGKVSGILDASKNPMVVPDYAKNYEGQKFTLSPSFEHGGPLGYGIFDEYTQSGTPDMSYSSSLARGWPLIQEQDVISAEIDKMSGPAQERGNKLLKELKNYRKKTGGPGVNPFSDRTKNFNEGIRNILDKSEYAFTPHDYKPEFRGDVGLTAEGKNIWTGGPSLGGTIPASEYLTNRIPSVLPGTKYEDAAGKIKTSIGSALPGSTLQETIDNAGMVMKNKNIAIPTLKSLQYSGKQGAFSSPAIDAAREGFNMTPEGYKNFIDLYGPKTTVADTIGETSQSATDLMPILGNALMIYGLLNDKPLAQAAAPQGASGTQIQTQNLYDRERYKYGLL